MPLTTKQRHARLVEMLRALLESKVQAEHDFSGEQREWHLPRLNTAFAIAAQLFPNELVEAMGEARTPYGDLIAD
jgi:hypothetical protein